MRTGTIDNQGALYAGGWQLVHGYIIPAGGLASYTIPNLTGDFEEEYWLICRFIDSATTGGYYLRFNNDSGNNYAYVRLTGINTTISSAIDASEAQIYLGYTNTNGYLAFSSSRITTKSGVIRSVITNASGEITGTTVDRIDQYAQRWTNTADEITSMVIGALNDKMAADTHIILLARRKLGSLASSGIKTGGLDVKGKVKSVFNRVASTILTSAVTSYTFTGLDGDVDTLYELIVRQVDGSGAGSSVVGTQFNSSGGTAYGEEYVRGVNPQSVSALRYINSDMFEFNYSGATGNLSMSRTLMYVKSGYIRTVLSDFTLDINVKDNWGTYIDGGCWNDTATNITSIRVISDNANGLGIGTILELWALKRKS